MGREARAGGKSAGLGARAPGAWAWWAVKEPRRLARVYDGAPCTSYPPQPIVSLPAKSNPTMTDVTENNDAPFGKLFAETWAMLQNYLADLDALELSKLSGADFTGTLRMLAQQPALGQSGALDNAQGKSPEQLALAIIQDRINTLTAKLPNGPEQPWGGRFLSRWRQMGGSLSSFKYDQIQKLKQADQEQVVQMFKSRMGSFQLSQMLRSSTPEDAADLLLRQQQMGALTVALILM